jgi:hypothetical protein
MPLSAKEEARLAALEAAIHRIEAKLFPPPPAPMPAKPVPGTLPVGPHGAGMNYTGPPSGTATAGGESWIKERKANGDWLDPNCGQWRDSSGNIVPAGPAVPVRGPERTAQHEMAVRLSDRMIRRARGRPPPRPELNGVYI